MNIAAKIRISLGALLTLLVTACATGTGSGGNSDLQTQYERTIPVCVGETDCALKMAAAREWVAQITGYELAIATDERIETSGWGRADVPAVRVDRASIGDNRHWILIEVNCGAAVPGDRFGARTCPPYWETAIDFNVAVSSAQPR